MTYQEMLRWGEEQLQAKGIYEYKSDTWILFSYAFRMSRVDFMFHCMEDGAPEARPSQWAQFQEMIGRRLQGIPVQYITREQNFYGFDFYVDERVLIPRQDTEVLVSCVQQAMQRRMLERGQTHLGRLLDLCTGSGCIAITLSHVLEWDEVWASDVSLPALAVAEKNNQALGGGVQFVHSDLFAAFLEEPREFDVIVSNPPYIASDVVDTLDVPVREHEPRLALDGHADGLYFYCRILNEAKRCLVAGGDLFLEIGADQGAVLKQMCREYGYRDVCVTADLAGLDRVLYAKWPGAGMDR